MGTKKWFTRLFILAALLVLSASTALPAMASHGGVATPAQFGTTLTAGEQATWQAVVGAEAPAHWAHQHNQNLLSVNGTTCANSGAEETFKAVFGMALGCAKWIEQSGGLAKTSTAPQVVPATAEKSAEELACTATFTNNPAASTLNVTGPANLQLFSLEDGRHIRFRVPAGETIRVQNKAYALWQYPSACPAVKVEQQMRDGAVKVENTNTYVAPSGAAIVTWEELWAPNSPYKGWVTR